jgi:hypothetical protein
MITLAALALGLLLPTGVAQASVHSANGLSIQTVTEQSDNGDDCEWWDFGCEDDEGSFLNPESLEDLDLL